MKPLHKHGPVIAVWSSPPSRCLEFVVAARSSAVDRMLLQSSFVGSWWGTICALSHLPVGSIRCLGRLPEGLGPNLAPTDLPPASAVSTAYAHSCAVLSDDSTVRCWGYGASRTRPPSDLGPVLALSSAAYYTCAIQANSERTVRCWGDPTGTWYIEPPADLTGAVSLDSQWYATCVGTSQALSGSTVQCWGRDDFSFNGLPPLPVLQVAVGENHVCMLAAGTGRVYCSGTNVGAYPPPDLPSVAAISAGIYFTCIILATNGTVRCWGVWGVNQLQAPLATVMTSLASREDTAYGTEAGTGRLVAWNPPNSLHVHAFGASLRAPSLRGTPLMLGDSASAELVSADLAPPLQFKRLRLSPSAVVVELQRADPSSSVPVPPAFLFQTQSDLKYPLLYTYTQADAGWAVEQRACPLMVVPPLGSKYELQCSV